MIIFSCISCFFETYIPVTSSSIYEDTHIIGPGHVQPLPMYYNSGEYGDRAHGRRKDQRRLHGGVSVDIGAGKKDESRQDPLVLHLLKSHFPKHVLRADFSCFRGQLILRNGWPKLVSMDRAPSMSVPLPA